ncbi:hypothetical protein N836_18130 [Leptolyngbya sp. Heron Island J]|nr:hypothetical protein N836_18130 [Leptolyngbya sp. Heron Island J]
MTSRNLVHIAIRLMRSPGKDRNPINQGRGVTRMEQSLNDKMVGKRLSVIPDAPKSLALRGNVTELSV